MTETTAAPKPADIDSPGAGLCRAKPSCCFPGCGTRLSIYNPDRAYCAQHSGQMARWKDRYGDDFERMMRENRAAA